MTDPFTPASLHLVEQPPIATATHEESKTVLQSAALRDFIRERIEQVEKHGHTLDQDMMQDAAEIAFGAKSYLDTGIDLELGRTHPPGEIPESWPFRDELFKPTTARACYIKAIAMLWAEVDRIDATQELIEAARPLIPQNDHVFVSCLFGPVGRGMSSAPFPSTVRRCRVCGCTETSACMTEDGPCAWAAADLCTACVGKPDPAGAA